MRIWLIFAVAGLGPYLIRASFIVLGSRVTLPPRVERSL
jgi:branched-subunit amino acid transport protein